jgi:hypothetical protein
MRVLPAAAAACVCLCAALTAAGQDADRRSYSTARLIGDPPVIDGRLDDPVWSRVPWGDGFTQFQPTDGGAASQATAFKVLFDAENLYVAVRLFDAEPARIERRLGRRDNVSGDDVQIQIDSYRDRQTAFGFTVNAAGVKYDAVTSADGAVVDASWDPIWFVETAVDDQGWTAEMRIPLTELRFADREEHVWGLQVGRFLWRKQELSRWQYIPQRAAGSVSRFGELRGISGITPRAQVELVPYAVGRVERYETQPGNPFATGKDVGGMAGLDGKLGVTNDVIVNFTVNPDFGQVEADPSVVNLTAFETFYQEKRPFFVEGANMFAMPITSFGTSAGDTQFYSRRIGRPAQYRPTVAAGAYLDQPDQTPILGAAKVAGKSGGGTTFALLDAVTAEDEAVVDLAGARRREVVEPLTNFLVGRMQRDMRGGNTLLSGMLTAVNRRLNEPQLTFLHDAAYSAGGNFAHYWDDKTYYVKGAAVLSHVRGSPQAILRTQRASPRFFQRPDATYLTLDPTRTSLSGHGGSIEAGRSGNSRLVVNGSFAWRSPGLELNDVGFQRVADYAVARVQGAYRTFQPFSVFRSFRVEFAPWVNFLWNGDRAGMGGYVAAQAQFTNYWSGFAVVESNTEYLDTMSLRGGPAYKTSPFTTVSASLNSDGRRKVTMGVNANLRRDRNHEIEGDNVGLTVGYRPSTALDVSVRTSYSSDRRALQYAGVRSVEGDSRYLAARLSQETMSLTVRANYAVTPTFTIQYYGQPFVSAGAYSDFKRFTDFRAGAYADRFHVFAGGEITRLGGAYLIDEQADGVTDYTIANPDFGFRQFRSNLVARWEYSPGSTVYVVWTQDRTGYADSGSFSPAQDLGGLFRVVPRNVFLVKFSRRFAR